MSTRTVNTFIRYLTCIAVELRENDYDEVRDSDFSGAEGSGTYQETTMTYDGYGRPQSKHVPEQQAEPNNSASTDYTTWIYNNDDTIHSVTDARGASSVYSYNNRRLSMVLLSRLPAESPFHHRSLLITTRRAIAAG